MYKVLNLYCGIGGNRKLWDNCEITAIENNPEIAKIYQDFFPDDKIIVADAHQYLLDHFKEFDFIWSSPPCPTHSKMQKTFVYSNAKQNINRQAFYPDMTLYQEILLLQHFFKGKYVVENVDPYYKPLIKSQIINRHLFWANFKIQTIKPKKIKSFIKADLSSLQNLHNINLSKYTNIDKQRCLRNCVDSNIGKAIFDRARNIQIEENAPQLKINYGN